MQKSNATQSAAARLNQNHDPLEMDRTRGGTHGVADEKGAVEARTGLTNSGSKTTSTKSPTFAGTLDADGHSRPISAHVESSRDQIFNVDQSVDKTPRKAASRSGDVRGLDSPSTHVATSTVARNHSLDSVSGPQVKGVTTDAHKQEDNPSKTIVNNNAARATDNPETIAASPVGYRTWIDVTGRYRTVARIVSVKNNMIRLQKRNGDFVSFPLDRLSQADVRFVRRWYPVSQ